MRKTKVILILFVTCILCIWFVFRRDIGAAINDQYKQTLLKHYFETNRTDDLNVLEYAAFCGNEEDSGRFIIWVGIAVQSDLSYEQLGNLLNMIYDKSLDLEYIPYDTELADSHGFTGIQKETAGLDTANGYYLVGITFEPKTLVDSRNRNGAEKR